MCYAKRHNEQGGVLSKIYACTKGYKLLQTRICGDMQLLQRYPQRFSMCLSNYELWHHALKISQKHACLRVPNYLLPLAPIDLYDHLMSLRIYIHFDNEHHIHMSSKKMRGKWWWARFGFANYLACQLHVSHPMRSGCMQTKYVFEYHVT